MKPLLTTFTLVFTLMFSSNSFAGWTKVDKNMGEVTFYVDFERIRKVDGFVYWWELSDYLKPTPHTDLSVKTYLQGDCKLFRKKVLSWTFHREPMGNGNPRYVGKTNDKWDYPSPNSAMEGILKSVCSR